MYEPFSFAALQMQQSKNCQSQGTFPAATLAYQSKDLSLIEFQRQITQHTRSTGVICRKVERQDWLARRQCFLATSLPNAS